MRRVALAVLLSALAMAAGLATAMLQSQNRSEAIALDQLQEECRMIEAIHGARLAEILALDWKPSAVHEGGAADRGATATRAGGAKRDGDARRRAGVTQ